MGISLTIYNETLLGAKAPAVTLDFLQESISVRELIRERVHEEIRMYQVALPDGSRRLVQPSEAEKLQYELRTRERRQIDWERQAQIAIEAFQHNGFFILVDNRPIESLEETITLTPDTQVSFLNLVPLGGG